jgi:hypothetical protein
MKSERSAFDRQYKSSSAVCINRPSLPQQISTNSHYPVTILFPTKMTLTKIEHKFAYQQLSYEGTANYQPYIKLTFHFSKLPHVSYEHFHRHWETIHADLTVGTKDFAINGVQRYVQVGAGNTNDASLC